MENNDKLQQHEVDILKKILQSANSDFTLDVSITAFRLIYGILESVTDENTSKDFLNNLSNDFKNKLIEYKNSIDIKIDDLKEKEVISEFASSFIKNAIKTHLDIMYTKITEI